MRKAISLLGVLGVVATFVAFTPGAMAAVTITVATGGGAISADTLGGTWTTLGPIVITEGAAGDIAVGAGVTIILTAPTGFEFNTVAPPDAVKAGADLTAITTPVAAAATTLTVTFTAGGVATVDTITIGGVTPIQVRPTAKNLPTGNITRTGGTSVIAGLANGAVVGTLTEVPGPTTALSCVASGSAGAVWLRWTNPGGDPKTAYDVRTSLAVINAGNYAAATQFANAWPVATEATVSQQLVNALTPNTTYYFAMKSNSANGLSTISNVVSCMAPTAYAGASDTKAPTSVITSPTANQGIKAGEPYTVTGTSADTGGSSVKQVEVSVDSGSTWSVAEAVNATSTGFDWKYVWSSPALGSYAIKSRATDWFGNVETPSAGVAVTVLTTVPTVTVEFGGPPAAAAPQTVSGGVVLPYPTPATVAEIQANITALQTKVVELLQQLLAQLTAQLSGTQ